MSAESCEAVQGVIAEIALGVAEGKERARALEHLTDCPSCSERLRELGVVADDLLLLAPSEEPPAGFESRVLDGFRPRARAQQRRRLWQVLVPAATALLAVAVTLVLAYRDDRDLASRTRSTLAEVHGEYLAGERLRGPGGRDAGNVFGYEGKPSWVLVTVGGGGHPGSESMPPGVYQLEAVTRDGTRVPIRRLKVEDGSGSAGAALPRSLPFREVAEVRLLGPETGEVYSAAFAAE